MSPKPSILLHTATVLHPLPVVEVIVPVDDSRLVLLIASTERLQAREKHTCVWVYKRDTGMDVYSHTWERDNTTDGASD